MRDLLKHAQTYVFLKPARVILMVQLQKIAAVERKKSKGRVS
jgi:hypothetical protein